MSPIRLGEPYVKAPEPAPDPVATALEQIAFALTALRGAVLEQQPIEAPSVYVEPPDLSAIVTAVNGLKPSVSADEIAHAITAAMGVPSAQSPDGLAEVATALERLEHRLKGIGYQAYGGGAVSLEQGQSISIANQLIPSAYDEIDLSYVGEDVTGVVYKQAGNTVATLTLTYTGTNLTRVVRS